MNKKTDKILNALVVDDERLARKELISMLTEYDNIQIVGEAENVETAISQIEKHNPDVIFLDIQMPGKSGFDLLEEKQIDAKIVFVTAFDQYAIRAFEVNAMDYLMKPVSHERLSQSIGRLFNEPVKVKIYTRSLNYDDKLFIDFGSQIRFLKISNIVYIHAEGDYTMVYTQKGEKGLVTKSMKEWEERLPENYFCRIHRSAIINLEYIKKVDKYHNYTYKILMRDIIEPLIVSRRYAKKIRNLFS